MSTPFQLNVPQFIVDEMIHHARLEWPNECCGLLAGMILEHSDGPRRGVVSHRFGLRNALASPTRFRSSPESMFQAMRSINALNLDVLAVYHSHPANEAVPSRYDQDECYDPHVVNLIISLQKPEPAIRGWWLSPAAIQEAHWECTPDPCTVGT
jgi:proteasome lid subunit RPN8/RPN11